MITQHIKFNPTQPDIINTPDPSSHNASSSPQPSPSSPTHSTHHYTTQPEPHTLVADIAPRPTVASPPHRRRTPAIPVDPTLLRSPDPPVDLAGWLCSPTPSTPHSGVWIRPSTSPTPFVDPVGAAIRSPNPPRKNVPMADDGRRHFDQGMCWRRKGSSMKREKEEGGGGVGTEPWSPQSRVRRTEPSMHRRLSPPCRHAFRTALPSARHAPPSLSETGHAPASLAPRCQRASTGSLLLRRRTPLRGRSAALP